MKRHFTIFISFIILTGSLISCCNKDDENDGAIISDLNIPDLNNTDQSDCFSFLDTLCILNDSAYKAAFKTTNTKCKSVSRPFVDFNKYSILIYKKFIRGNVRFNRNVNIDTVNKIVIYRISTDNCFCPDKCETQSLNIVLIPKISKEYKVNYK